MGKLRRKGQLEQEIAEKQLEVAKIEKELNILEALKPRERIAIGLHDILCRHNHTDGCSWYHEVKEDVHDWTRSEHEDWLKKGVRLEDYIIDHDITEDELFEIVNLTNAL